MVRSLLRCCRRRQLLLAVWSALIVVSTVTVGAVLGLAAVSLQFTVAGWMLVDDATGSTSGIVAACACVLEPRSTARLLVVVVGLAGGGVPEPDGTESVQSTSTCWPAVPLITACG